MNVKVNGKEQTFDKGSVSVRKMLALCNVAQPDMVSVQLNGEFIKKEDYDRCIVKKGDEIDFLYFMGGGSRKRKGK